MKITVKSKSQIIIGERVTETLQRVLPHHQRIIFITDKNIYSLYPHLVAENPIIITGLGEENKTITSVEAIFEELLRIGADRHTFIVGMGGGIVTDITGFVASTYMRGCRFGFISTTLLSQVDASVGGKNGVNFGGYKNIIGTFNQPEFVICDSAMLDTLPEREMRTGMAEMVKIGLVGDSKLFYEMSRAGYEGLIRDRALIERLIYRCVGMKAEIVERDEREGGERKKLNLGHTVAHAIEKCTSRFTHGEAVAIGLCTAAAISVRLGYMKADEAAKVTEAVEALGLPTTSGIDKQELLTAIRSDKKKEGDTIDYVVMNGIGDCKVVKLKFDELDAIF